MYVRRAVKQDSFSEIANLYLLTWQDTYQDILPDSFLQSLTSQQWEKRLETKWPNMFLAFTDCDLLMGVITYGKARKDEDKDCQEIYSFYVLPSYQKRGVGTALMQAVLENLSNKPEGLVVYALEQNRSAANFYLKHGFIKQLSFEEIFKDEIRVVYSKFFRLI